MGTYNGCLLILLTALQDLSYVAAAALLVRPSQGFTLGCINTPRAPPNTHTLSHPKSCWPTHFLRAPIYNGGDLFALLSRCRCQICFVTSALHSVDLSTHKHFLLPLSHHATGQHPLLFPLPASNTHPHQAPTPVPTVAGSCWVIHLCQPAKMIMPIKAEE